MFKSYPKIEGLFKRKDGSKELDLGNYRNEYLEYLKNVEWVCTEKIDGTNICIEWDGHNFHFYGHTEKSELPKDLLEKLQCMFDEVMEEKVEELFGETEVNFYGEGYGAGIQKGSGYSDYKNFVLFDVYFPNSNSWMSPQDMKRTGASLGLDVVNEIDVKTDIATVYGNFYDAIYYVITTEKALQGKGEAPLEGLVMRPKLELKDKFGQRIIVKIKKCDFLAVRSQLGI